MESLLIGAREDQGEGESEHAGYRGWNSRVDFLRDVLKRSGGGNNSGIVEEDAESGM